MLLLLRHMVSVCMLSACTKSSTYGHDSYGPPLMQAKDALVHPYFDELDKATIDLLESETVRLREGTPSY